MVIAMASFEFPYKCMCLAGDYRPTGRSINTLKSVAAAVVALTEAAGQAQIDEIGFRRLC